ncbi:ABC transporter substrate-binding protein [Vibrio ezurae]|uniref:Putative ABC transporter substrate-binding protein n=1 Tax=Vibrio ezurae NBRC 102218 TaxID=1219080 RepID=U3CPE2_9VIBR|nr:ABC transporter substrate-binding protein [Vibrio ezurae]GAD80008.1 putative ABC transporter substrate-binding protein [Vibrio ezurae NBRC 102218]
MTSFKTKFSAVLASVALLFSNAVFAKEKQLTLMLDWFVNPNHGPIVIAQQKGMFAKEGLKVTIQEPADPSVPSKLVAANQVDLAISYQPSFLIDVASGLPLVWSGTLLATPLNTLTVLDNSKINTLADLKGKTVGVSVSGSDEAIIGRMLKNDGVDFSDIKIVNVGWALSSSLASGRVDAIWGGMRNFESHQLELEGYKSKSFYPEEHGIPPYDELMFVANAKHYDKDAITRFNKALELATQYIVNHPEQAWKEFVAYNPDTLDNELNHRAWLDTLTRFALRPSAMNKQRYDDYSHFMQQLNIIKTIPDSNSYLIDF